LAAVNARGAQLQYLQDLYASSWTSHHLHDFLTSRALLIAAAHTHACCQERQEAKQEAGGTMSSLDQFAEFFVAVVFLCAGIRKIFSYKPKKPAEEARPAQGLYGLPYELLVAVALFEIAAALALVAPVDPEMHVQLVRLAAVGLALLTVAASIYRVRHKQSAAPTLALFFMTMFVIVGRWP
jgi:uncharacterized membrane protein YphA (DoxX/SURF4 family)